MHANRVSVLQVCSTHIVVVVVGMRVLAVAGKGAIVVVWEARGEQVAGAVGEFVVEVVAPLGQHGTTQPVATVDAPIDATGAGQSGVLQHVAIHLCGLVEVAWRVVLYRGRNRGGEEKKNKISQNNNNCKHNQNGKVL